MTGEGRYRKQLVSFIGVLAGVLALGLLFVTVSEDGRRMIGGPGTMFGWALPLVSLFVIVAVTWLLLARDSRDVDSDDPHYVTCEACGQSILEDWRLCPYCGAQVREWRSSGQSAD